MATAAGRAQRASRFRGSGSSGPRAILGPVLGAILTAMVTPFDADLRVDEAAAAALAHHLVEHGSDGLVMAGTTGEASTLTDDEKVALYRLAVREVGGRRERRGRHRQQRHRPLGAPHAPRRPRPASTPCLVVTPYYNRPPRAGIVGHVAAIAEVGLPVILYNIPSRSGVNLAPDLIAELAEIDARRGREAGQPGPRGAAGRGRADVGLDALRRQRRHAAPGGRDGRRRRHLGRLAPGGRGDGRHRRGGAPAATSTRRGAATPACSDLYAGLFVTTSPILIKAALEMTGLIPSDRLRLPLVEATPVQRDILRTVLERAGHSVAGRRPRPIQE